MAESKPQAPKAEEQAPQAEEKRPQQSYQEQQADLNVMAFNIEASRRTGKSLEEATALVQRLTTEGDFFDDRGRWTLDVAGYPVCHLGWKPEPIEPPSAP